METMRKIHAWMGEHFLTRIMFGVIALNGYAASIQPAIATGNQCLDDTSGCRSDSKIKVNCCVDGGLFQSDTINSCSVTKYICSDRNGNTYTAYASRESCTDNSSACTPS